MPTVHHQSGLVLDPVTGVAGVPVGGTGSDMSATGGTDHAVMQVTVGGAFTTRATPWVYIAATGLDQTAELQAAVDGSRRDILLGPGTFLVTNTILIGQNQVRFLGSGRGVTSVKFTPTTTGLPLIHFKAPTATTIVRCEFGDLTLHAQGEATLQKIAVRLTDVSEFYMHDVSISSWLGANSIGLQTRGRDTTEISRVTISANTPISIEGNPNHASLDLDHWKFDKCYLIASGQPNVAVEDGVFFSTSQFSNQAWALGTHGFYYNDTLTNGFSNSLIIEDVRWEQGTGGTGYAVYFAATHGLRHLYLARIHAGSAADVKGFYLRNVDYATLQNCNYTGTIEALNVDGTVQELHLINCFFNGTSTISTTGLTRVFAAAHPDNATIPIHSTEIWQASANTEIGSGVIVSDDSFNVADSADQTKRLQFEVSGITTATTRTLTAPNYDGTIATLAGTETLSGKTFNTTSTPLVITDGGTDNVDLSVEDDGSLELRNGTGAVALRVYSSRDDASNYSRGYVAHGSSGFEIGSTAAGSGVVRGVGLAPGGVLGLGLDPTNPHPRFPVSHKRVTTQFDKTTTTLENIGGLTYNVTAGKKYQFWATLYTTSDIGGGVKAAIAGTATATSIIYESVVYSAGVPVAVGTARATALGTAVGNVTAVTVARIDIVGTIVVNAAGTLTCQFAENAAVATSSVLVNSVMRLLEIAA